MYSSSIDKNYVRSTAATASKKRNNDHFHPYFAIIVFKLRRKVPYFLLSRINHLSAISHTGKF